MTKKEMLDPKRINSFITEPGSPFKEVFHGVYTETSSISPVSV